MPEQQRDDRMTSQRERVMLFALAIVLAIVALNVRTIAGRTWDDVHYHVDVAPPRLAAATQIHAGTFPRWWDGAGFGVPLAAEPSHGAAYPPLWLATSPRALDLVLVAHLAWLAIGLALWARRSASDRASGVAAILVATSGVVTAALFAGALPALAHVPWVGYTASGLARVGKPMCRARHALALAGLLALIALAGELAMFVDALVLACVLGTRRTTWRYLAAALAAALAIGCIQWLPALAVHGAGAEAHGLPLARLLELVVPVHSGAGWSGALFVGAPLVALAAVAVFARSRSSAGSSSAGSSSAASSRAGAWAGRSRAMAAFAIVLAVLALVVGRGGWPAVLGAPELHLAVLTVLAGVVAARGLDHVAALAIVSSTASERPITATDGQRAVMRALIAVAVATALVTIAFVIAHGAGDPNGHAALDAGLGAVGVIVALLFARKIATRTAGALALAALVVPSIAALHATAPSTPRDDVPLWGAAARLQLQLAAPQRLYRPDSLVGIDDNSLADALDTLAGTSAARFDIARANSNDPARLPIEDRAWTAASHGGGMLLDRYGIGLAVLPKSVAEGGARPVSSDQRFETLGTRGGAALVRYPGTPVAAVYGNWMFLSDERATFAQLFPAQGMRGAGRGRVVLAGGGTPSEEADMTPQPCTVSTWAPGAIDLRCTTSEDGYAVISSAARDGWTVTVDDKPAEWVVADAIRRAVAVPTGTHAIAWRYRAPLLAPALIIAAFGALVLAVLGWLARPQ